LNSTLDVDGATTLNNTLDVDGATTLNNTLDVDGATTLNNTLDVDGATTLNNTLDVDGATTLNNTLQILTDQGGHVATFINTNGERGDGLLIKLGKTHGAWDGSDYLSVPNPATFLLGGTVNAIRTWFNGQSLTISDILDIFPAAALAGALANLTNAILEEINDGLDLPWTIIPQTTLFPGIDLGAVEIDAIEIGPYAIPAIPLIPTDGLPTLEIPNLSGTSVTNSLTRENHYVTFEDKDGRQTGAIKAESVSDWRDNTLLDDTYIAVLAGSFIKIDLLSAVVQGFSAIAELAQLYNTIGVAYESGNGDYAEWLERENPAEHIAAGDIVGVRGGKISKDVAGAEQTMVVSHKPIVLGNMPDQQERYKGNDVAFMGQVPVKIMGPVATGDYIVASGTVKGYGIAVSAANMQADDYTKAVGRSWANDPAEGPKMVNTVIGVHNGDWVKVVKKIDDRQKKSDERQLNTDRRLKSLETKLQSILGLDLNEEVSVTP